MRVLVVGSGGREHALVWKLKQSPLLTEIYCAPGNPGIATLADCVDIDPSDIVKLADFAEKFSISLTVVGPELPLMLGIADEFEKRGLAVFGPTRAAAELEGSKAFAKDFMARHGIPTAKFKVVNDVDEAKSVIQKGELGLPLVIKADGLAGGKGVSIVADKKAALAEADRLLTDKALGTAGSKVVLEECLAGEEVSFFVLSDGAKVLPFVAAQDQKRALDNDEGPNTGGMGCVCPAMMLRAETLKRIMQEIVLPTISKMAADGRRYQGLLYSGLMITKDGPKVLEYNVRFGDPETQAVLPRYTGDLLPLLKEVADGHLGQHGPEWSRDPAITVTLASGGYPGSYATGKKIEGVDLAKGVEIAEGVSLFHAGTKKDGDDLVTGGGRVLAVTGIGQNLKAAIERTYKAVDGIQFEGMHYRKDIGKKALACMSGDGSS